jgi:hypothetical protein
MNAVLYFVLPFEKDIRGLCHSSSQELVDRGWRRSGTYLYRAWSEETCCPLYTIRLDTGKFQQSKTQRQARALGSIDAFFRPPTLILCPIFHVYADIQVLKRWQRYLDGEDIEQSLAKVARPESAMEAESQSSKDTVPCASSTSALLESASSPQSRMAAVLLQTMLSLLSSSSSSLPTSALMMDDAARACLSEFATATACAASLSPTRVSGSARSKPNMPSADLLSSVSAADPLTQPDAARFSSTLAMQWAARAVPQVEANTMAPATAAGNAIEAERAAARAAKEARRVAVAALAVRLAAVIAAELQRLQEEKSTHENAIDAVSTSLPDNRALSAVRVDVPAGTSFINFSMAVATTLSSSLSSSLSEPSSSSSLVNVAVAGKSERIHTASTSAMSVDTIRNTPRKFEVCASVLICKPGAHFPSFLESLH